ncbi:MAG: phosphatidylglycerophosphatase A, partial [Bdellovibrionales bacterium]|nr:phosphatidylglycerophosphatase A [Bdellovibrionales bacterium]
MYQNPFARALSIKERIASFWVTMGGCGISPIGPGTVGSIAGCGLFWLALPWAFSLKLATIGFAFVISIVAIEYLQRRNDAVKDASWIVIDEGVGVWIALLSWDGSIDMMVASFV